LLYTEDKCNIKIDLNPVQLTVASVGPGMIQPTVIPQQRFGLHVTLDVNNKAEQQFSVLTTDDIESVLTRANDIWPDRLIQFLNRRKMS
jgi:hypothetical protein